MGKKSNKKSGKNAPVERPDATQGGPRAKVKKERVQPPKTVLRPGSLEDVAATSAAEPVAAAEPKGKKKHAKAAKKSKSAKKTPSGEQVTSGEKVTSDEKATSGKKNKKNKKNEKSKKGKRGPEAKQDGKSALEEPSSLEKARASAADEGLSERPGPGARERTVRDAALLSDEGDEAHGFARLIRAIPGIVALVEQHDTSVHRAVFDTYVTAVVEFGVDAADLTPIDIRTVAPDAPTVDESPTRASGRSGSGGASIGSGARSSARRARRPSGIASAEAPEPSSAPGAPERVADEAAGPGRVRSQGSSVRASTRVRAGQGRASAAGGTDDSAADSRRGGRTPISSRTRAGARGAASSRPRAASPARRGLEDLASDLKPTNNGQRIAIAVAAILSTGDEVSAAAIANAFERMTWRVPVNVAASVRQAARAGLIELEGPTGTRLTEEGERYVAGS